MKIYKSLNFIGLKRSYALKFLFTAFVGTHIPLIGIIIYFIFFPNREFNPIIIIGVILLLTLIACAVTLFVLNKLLAPIKLAAKSIEEFKASKNILDVPENYHDEAGILLKNIKSTLVEVKNLSEERKNFTSLIIHDLRSPLSAIKGLAYIIKNSTSNKEILEYADLIHEKGESGIKIIKDTMYILETDNYTLNSWDLEKVTLKEFVLKQIEEVKEINPNKTILFNVNINDQDTINVNANLFSHILQNLFSNAIKFSNNHGEVEIDGLKTEKGYCLSIKDHGVGFDPEISEEIFEKFTPVRRKGTQDEPTTGLGLYLTKILVKKHKGEIKAESKGPNKGATFIIEV